MILFTGHGDIAESFSQKYNCEIVSMRNASLGDIEKLLPSFDVVIHNAANLQPMSTEQATEDNFVLTKRILDTLHKVNPEARFVYLSSMSFLKAYDEYLNPLEMTPYAFSKYLGEIYTLHHTHSNAVSVRFSTIFFRNPVKDGLSKIIYDATTTKQVSIINNGEAKRDFLPLEILVRYLHKISQDAKRKRAYTLCSGRPTSFAQVIDWLKNDIEELKTENSFVNQSASVMHEFSTESIKALGEIKFELKDFVIAYAKTLQRA
jgi:nucleoside-diphosphate-sugar epimerase